MTTNNDDIYETMQILLDYLNIKGNETTDTEHTISLEIQKALIENRIKEND